METALSINPSVDYELERGKAVPSKNHSVIQNNLSGLFFMNYRKKYRFMSEISLELENWSSTPDLAIFPKMDIDFFHDEIKMTTVPLGVIEILSPTQGIQELSDKAERYFLKGVKSAWLVVPSLHSIAVYNSPYTFQMFSNGIVKDEILDIEIDLNEVFS